jgi:drug/metabolite transporter (DMT)-like permease
VEIVLALCAALSWGVSDFSAGVVSRRISAVTVTMVTLGLGGLIALPIALGSESAPNGRTVLFGLLAGATTGVGVTLLFEALAVGVIGAVAPIVGGGAALPVVAGLVTGERPAAVQLAGVGLVIAGVITIARATSGEATEQARDPRRGIVLAIIASVALGCYYLCARGGATHGTPLWFASIGQISAAIPLLILTAVRRRGRLPRSDVGLLAVIAAINAAGWLLSTLALRGGLLSVVSVLIALYPAITVMLAAIVLRERLSRPQIAGAVVTFAGVALIAAGG